MGVKAGQILAIAVTSLLWLAGCETTSTTNPFKTLAQATSPELGLVGSETNASLVASSDPPAKTPELVGSDPNDDLNLGKKYFRQGSYGLAERQFRKAVEQHPRDAEAWLGLAASYDRLRRFDLADRAYAQAIRIVGKTPEVLNNQGFSYMLRGDYRRARAILLEAQAKDPANRHIQNNFVLLDESVRKKRPIN
jgi:Flp pilus assembly protein TadD